MSSDVYNRLSFLKSQIERHNKLYHGHDDPVISDKEFDNICVEYDNLVARNPNLGFTKREDVGFEPLEKFGQKFAKDGEKFVNSPEANQMKNNLINFFDQTY